MVGDAMTMDIGLRPAAYRAKRAALILRNLPADLRAFRDDRDLTMRQVADETGLSRSTVWRIEHGRDVRMYCLLAVLDWMGNRQ